MLVGVRGDQSWGGKKFFAATATAAASHGAGEDLYKGKFTLNFFFECRTLTSSTSTTSQATPLDYHINLWHTRPIHSPSLFQAPTYQDQSISRPRLEERWKLLSGVCRHDAHFAFSCWLSLSIYKGKGAQWQHLISSEGLSLVIANERMEDTFLGLFRCTTPLAIRTPSLFLKKGLDFESHCCGWNHDHIPSQLQHYVPQM